MYQANHVKRNPENGDIAIRTIFSGSGTPQSSRMEWLVASSVTGPHHTSTVEVEDWDDLYVATEADKPPNIPGL